jgi:hypothetical protein
MEVPSSAYLGSKRMSNHDLVEFFLKEAERRYGPRFPDVTFEVQNSGARGPLDSCWNADTNHVVIRLPQLEEHDRVGQLAQESIHVLSPATSKEATEFDRGLATLFAVRCFKYHHPSSRDYVDAFEAVKLLEDLCEKAIPRLRDMQPRVALIRADDILGECNKFPGNKAHFLVRTIY